MIAMNHPSEPFLLLFFFRSFGMLDPFRWIENITCLESWIHLLMVFWGGRISTSNIVWLLRSRPSLISLRGNSDDFPSLPPQLCTDSHLIIMLIKSSMRTIIWLRCLFSVGMNCQCLPWLTQDRYALKESLNEDAFGGVSDFCSLVSLKTSRYSLQSTHVCRVKVTDHSRPSIFVWCGWEMNESTLMDHHHLPTSLDSTEDVKQHFFDGYLLLFLA